MWDFPRPHFGVPIIRILLFRVLYQGPLFPETHMCPGLHPKVQSQRVVSTYIVECRGFYIGNHCYELGKYPPYKYLPRTFNVVPFWDDLFYG